MDISSAEQKALHNGHVPHVRGQNQRSALRFILLVGVGSLIQKGFYRCGSASALLRRRMRTVPICPRHTQLKTS